MDRKLIGPILGVIIIVLILLLVSNSDSHRSIKIEENNGISIGSEFDLVADKATRIVYIKNETYGMNIVYTPYYSENGKLCRYIDGKVAEIE